MVVVESTHREQLFRSDKPERKSSGPPRPGSQHKGHLFAPEGQRKEIRDNTGARGLGRKEREQEKGTGVFVPRGQTTGSV